MRGKVPEGLIRPFVKYLDTEASSGIVLMLSAVAALIWANSPAASGYMGFWHTPVAISVGTFRLENSLVHWINDGLMAVFFFVVGLEIKREVLVGELASAKKAALPIIAAIGGMVVPALIYVAINAGGAGVKGWGIPMATDIAFAIGVVSLLGSRVPLSLKVFLAAVAIVDDIGAVLVIAAFYSREIDFGMLGAGAGILACLAVLNRSGVRNPIYYIVPGIFLWGFFLYSGVHATVAGVLLAMLIPTRVHLIPSEFSERARKSLAEFDRASTSPDRTIMNEEQVAAVHAVEESCERAQMPLQRLEHTLQPFVSYVVMPIFALANAGVPLNAEAIRSIGDPIGLGVFLGLLVGKPVGIVLASWLAVRSGLARLPTRVGWRQIVGVGTLAGIGFTMSLFVADLAFTSDKNVDSARLSILTASLVAGTLGYVLLRRNTRSRIVLQTGLGVGSAK